MRLSLWLCAFALALAVGACDRQQSASQTGPGSTSGQTKAGAASGQASEGSTDERKAPQRPSSK